MKCDEKWRSSRGENKLAIAILNGCSFKCFKKFLFSTPISDWLIVSFSLIGKKICFELDVQNSVSFSNSERCSLSGLTLPEKSARLVKVRIQWELENFSKARFSDSEHRWTVHHGRRLPGKQLAVAKENNRTLGWWSIEEEDRTQLQSNP